MRDFSGLLWWVSSNYEYIAESLNERFLGLTMVVMVVSFHDECTAASLNENTTTHHVFADRELAAITRVEGISQPIPQYVERQHCNDD